MQDKQLLQLKEQIINDIKKRVLKIREDLGLKKVEFDIVDIEIEGKVLIIYTKTELTNQQLLDLAAG